MPIRKNKVIADITRLLHKARPIFNAAAALAPLQDTAAKSTKSKRRRKPGGGRKPKLTGAEVTKLRRQLSSKLEEVATLHGKKAMAEYKRLRTLKGAAHFVWESLPKAKRDDVSMDTLIRSVVRPVLQQAE